MSRGRRVAEIEAEDTIDTSKQSRVVTRAQKLAFHIASSIASSMVSEEDRSS